MIRYERTTSSNPDFNSLVKKLNAELWERYGETQALYDGHNHVDDNRTVIIAYENSTAIGCGCFKQYDDAAAEIKRMFVTREKRGQGVATGLLRELCQWAGENGFHKVILETGSKQPEAIHLYQKQGFSITPNYPPYVGMELSICMEKGLF
jgi:GNAT superfamily N-acetyltransferase